MRKKFFLLGLGLLSVVLAVPHISVVNAPIDLGPVNIDSGFYGAPPGNITLEITTDGPATIYADIDGALTSEENFQLPGDGLQWQVYYWTGKEGNQPFKGEILYGGAANWVPYRRGGAPLFRINGAVSDYRVQLGTTVRRIPSVQPNGVYATKINFYVM